MTFKGLLFLSLFPISVTAAEIDLVKLGKETFHALGYAECHSEIKNDTSVKTGPGLYGLFTKEPRMRDLIETAEEHKISVTADFKYFEKSVREPATELAISEVAPTN